MKTLVEHSATGSRFESDMVRLLARTLSNDGYRVRTEVPNMGQSADIIATRSRWVTAIEAKLTDWRRALEQCRAHELVADFVCIAIGTVSVPDELIRAVHECGYGLLHCPPSSSACVWVVRPGRNKSVWGPERTRLVRVMKGIGYEC